MMRLLAGCALILLVSIPLHANPEGVIVRSASVYGEPDGGGVQVGKLDAGARVSIFDRRGGWKEVFSESQNLVGWVRSFQVREGDYAPQAESAGESDSRGFLSGLAAFSRKASRFFSSDSSNTASSTATIGVRGLSEEQIRTAKPDLAEFEKMQGFASDSVRLGRFISDGQLNAVQVGYIKLKKETRQQKK